METHPHSRITIEDYAQFVGVATVERIINKAKALSACCVAHVNSTQFGGGVAELLSSLVLLMNSIGIRTEWRTLQGTPDFFSITKKIHNGLQGGKINLTERKKQIYEDVVRANAMRNRMEDDFVVIHDPQPLPLIDHYRKHGPWIWRCHLDLTTPNKAVWDYLKTFIEKYDAVIFSIKEYMQNLKTPTVFIMPAIDPFSVKNRKLSEEEVEQRLKYYNIPTDLPLVSQISRFDLWKDPKGVIEAFKIARKEIDCTLVLLGNVALDDPEGLEVYESLLSMQEERIIILSVQDTALVNALQSRSAVVLQKSIREGFGLTVAEAMWKGTPVIGGNVGGIRYQIEDGVTGFLVSSVEQAAARMVELLKNEKLRREMGERARETVMKKFLMSRYVEDYLDLFNSFETIYRLIYRASTTYSIG